MVPHLINQMAETELKTTIQEDNPIRFSKIYGLLRLTCRGMERRFFALFNRFEDEF